MNCRGWIKTFGKCKIKLQNNISILPFNFLLVFHQEFNEFIPFLMLLKILNLENIFSFMTMKCYGLFTKKTKKVHLTRNRVNLKEDRQILN